MRRIASIAALLVGACWLSAGAAHADVRPELRTKYGNQTERLRVHFGEVLADLAARDTSDLTPSQRAKRAAAIERLRAYRERGAFPVNDDFARYTPYFIDNRGTRCAMAYLIEESGAVELVARIAREDNHAYVHDLAADPELVAWLGANGITEDEAARIQPSYEPPACDEACREDEECVRTEEGTACSMICDPEDTEACGADSTCENALTGNWVCFPPVVSDGPRPERSCSAAGGGCGAAALVILGAIVLARRRRRR